MKNNIGKYRFYFQVQSFFWTFMSCGFYKIALLNMNVFAKQVDVQVKVGLFKIFFFIDSVYYSIYDFGFFFLVSSVVLQGIGVILSLQEKKLERKTDKDSE